MVCKFVMGSKGLDIGRANGRLLVDIRIESVIGVYGNVVTGIFDGDC